MKRIALIVAGGRGERMKSNIPKQFIVINKLPILMYTIKQFSHLENDPLERGLFSFNFGKIFAKNIILLKNIL